MSPVSQVGIDGRPYAYASVEDVQAMIPGARFNATSSKPTASQVAHFCDVVSNDLDSILSVTDYVTPVPTGATASIEMLRGFAAVGAAYKTAMSMPQGAESKHAKNYGEDWKAILGGLEKGKRQLPDAPRDPGKNTRARGGGGDDPCDRGPTFTRDSAFSQR